MKGANKSLGVSPVVAVILMVAVTVILSAVIGTFVLDLGSTVSDSTTGQNIGVTTTPEQGNVTVQVVTGTADELRVLVNGTVQANITQPEPGDSVTVPATENSSIAIVTVTDGESTVVSTDNPIESTSNTLSSSDTTAPTDGLLAHWKLNGNASDSAGTNDGVINGNTSFVDTSRGTVATFDGSGDYINTTLYSNELDFPITVSLWVKLDRTPPLSDRDNPFGNPYTFDMDYDPSSNIHNVTTYSGVGGTVYTHSTSKSSWSSNTWYLLTVTVTSSGSSTIYVNGTEDSTGSLADSTANYSSYIGAAHDSSGFLKGDIDDVRVYNRSLNASEVQDLYNATK